MLLSNKADAEFLLRHEILSVRHITVWTKGLA